MRQRGILHRLTSLTASRPGRSVGVALIALLAAATPAAGAVTLSASRSELLYSTDANPDCSKLHKLSNAALPFYVTRIQATVEGAPAGVPIRYRWSIGKGQAGMLLADLDLGPGQETSAIDGMCADFGNACVLTGSKLLFYNEQKILFVAPTCDALPKDTTKQFHGALARIRLKASAGGRRLGGATARVGYGRDGALKLYAWDAKVRKDQLGNPDILVLEDGLGKPSVGVPLNVVFGAVVQPPSVAPGPIVNYDFKNGASGAETVSAGCSVPTAPPVNACAEVDYMTPGKFVPTVAAKFQDGSALCDNMTVTVILCNPGLRLDVTPKPKRSIYDPNNPQQSPVEVVVRLTDTSRPRGNLPPCPFLLRGAGVLTCTEDLRVGSVKDSKTTTFDLPHCSKATDEPCVTDQECPLGEICLTQPHCSTLVTRSCGNDEDCSNTGTPPPCHDCKDNETCVRVLNIPPRIGIAPGESIILLDQPVMLRNKFPDTAVMKDTWVAHTTLPPETAQTVVKYKIRGRPSLSPGQ